MNKREGQPAEWRHASNAKRIDVRTSFRICTTLDLNPGQNRQWYTRGSMNWFRSAFEHHPAQHSE